MGHSLGKTGTTSKEEYLKEPRHVSLYLQSDFKSVLYLEPLNCSLSLVTIVLAFTAKVFGRKRNAIR